MLLPGTKVIARYDLDGAKTFDECIIIKRDGRNNYLAICIEDYIENLEFWAREEDFEVPYIASDLVYHNASGRVCIFQQEDMNGYCLSYYGSTEDAFYASADEITKIPFNVFYGV